jgi:hypothetical protein
MEFLFLLWAFGYLFRDKPKTYSKREFEELKAKSLPLVELEEVTDGDGTPLRRIE